MTEPKDQGRRGCLLNGLLLASVVSLLVLAGGLIGMRYFKQMMHDFTSPTAVPVPVEQVTPVELSRLEGRVEKFRTEVRLRRPVAPLELSAKEVNALIANDPDLESIKGKLYVKELKKGGFTGQISAPLDQLNLKVFAGRHLNGEAEFQLSFANGLLRLNALAITVNGRPVPQTYMDAIRRQNLVQPLNTNSRPAVALERLESIEIQEGKLVITPKSGSD